MGFLRLLPFVLITKGAPVTQVGFALSLTFAGGAAGKFFCGLIAARAGVLRIFGVIAAVVLLVLPLTLGLRPALRALRAA